MEHNYSTFNACREIFKKKGIVLIFSEGRCINEWHLRPLKKGTARLAISSWENGIPLTVLPTGINYNRFHSYDKNIHLHFAQPFGAEVIEVHETFGKKVASFNRHLTAALSSQVYEIPALDNLRRKEIFYQPTTPLKKMLLCLPALAGLILHYPFYKLAQAMARKFGRGNDHFDSIFVAVLFVFYPWYILLLIGVGMALYHTALLWLLLPLMPFCAWSILHLKRQLFGGAPTQ